MRNINPNGRMYAARNPGQNAAWGRPGNWGKPNGPGYYYQPAPRQEAPVQPDSEPPAPELDTDQNGQLCPSPCCPPPQCCIPGPLPPCNRPVPLSDRVPTPTVEEQIVILAETETAAAPEDCQPPLAGAAELVETAELTESVQGQTKELIEEIDIQMEEQPPETALCPAEQPYEPLPQRTPAPACQHIAQYITDNRAPWSKTTTTR